ncbi:HWE histidine kinase domain-containing protein [Jannaschia seohaensis]|uniref:histidine kinase n=1 Tax=Jannaschia seohaensis TaxID=475081 RepID=A0A2Y9C3U6_9RHOB|nr:HWE histidine kinase domain-containing protein [Jannaschia seohaensis]PWJ22155.1 light-regulated signal transduction histidine kinase (bacteriophytochrome) [Jannaschia seohaensis]SSA38433.1 Bacteriophytochrome (light-regulated signal transduction histidine kinase) [Jannaschia seohaensis]
MSQAEIDLTTCDREPIHLLGTVQAFGCLIAVSADWMVLHASENVETMLGFPLADLIGTRFETHFPASVAHVLRGRTQIFQSGVPIARLFGEPLFEDARRFDISIHPTARGFIFEFEEKSATEHRDDFELVQTLVAQLRSQPELDGLMTVGAAAMRHLSGFDRVMIYRFEDDGSGTVIAESRDPDIESYFGLRFPASDIPKQARALYLRSPLRLIADTEAPVSPIRPARCPEARVIDLSSAVTRAVSPIHLQYLRNMGTRASMSSSIIRNNALWGLFACHHMTPRYVDYERRSAIELFTQLFNYELADRINTATQEEVALTRRLHDRIMARVSSGRGLMEDFATLAEDIHDLIDFDGIAVFSDDSYLALGAAPTEAEFIRLVRFLNTTTMGAVYATTALSESYEHAAEIADRVAGLLVIPISRTPRDYIVLFRAEIRQSVTWAGSPAKSLVPTPEGDRLQPRQSFAAWQEEVSGQCESWGEATLNIAKTLRYTLLEVILKVTDEANRATEHMRQKQELMVAELNHRVRNILNLITGIVSQGNRDMPSIDAYVSDLEGRIQSLARAHDQITRQDWEATSLDGLLRTEVSAYVTDTGTTLLLEEPDVQLTPGAFTTIALVVHELVTNSVKYGALSRDSGQIRITKAFNSAGALLLRWAEMGGPPVCAPDRQGFGTSIIERSIPFDLHGRARLRYQLTGLVAEFELPAIHFEPVDAQASPLPLATDLVKAVAGAASSAADEAPDMTQSEPLEGFDVLLVEDNLIVAMDVYAKLVSLGARKIHMTNSVKQAKATLDALSVDCAVLDVNLGTETSIEIATRLHLGGIPFVLATGYGRDGNVLTGFPEVSVLTKPYDVEALRLALIAELPRKVRQAGPASRAG